MCQVQFGLCKYPVVSSIISLKIYLFLPQNYTDSNGSSLGAVYSVCVIYVLTPIPHCSFIETHKISQQNPPSLLFQVLEFLNKLKNQLIVFQKKCLLGFCLVLFLDPLFCTIDLFGCLSSNNILFDYHGCIINLEIRQCQLCNFVIFSKLSWPFLVLCINM